MSAAHKFTLGDYVNVSADFVASYRFHYRFKGRYPAGKVAGFSSTPHFVNIRIDDKPTPHTFHMDDWERP